MFYYGTSYLPEESVLKLSDSYRGNESDPQLELKVRILNINEGNNEELKKQCNTLREYMQYVDCVRKKAEEMPIEEAVVLAVDECIEKGILAEFLLKNKVEVVPMSIFEYDEEKTLKIIRRDEREMGYVKGHTKDREEGHQQGLSEGLARGRTEGIVQILLSLVKDNMLSVEEAAKRAELSEAEFIKMLEEDDLEK